MPSNKRKELVVCQSQSTGLSRGLEFFRIGDVGLAPTSRARKSGGKRWRTQKKRNSLHDPERSIEARASLSSLFPLIRPSVNHDQLSSLTLVLYIAVKSKASKQDEAKSKTKDGHSLSGIDSELDWVDSKRAQQQAGSTASRSTAKQGDEARQLTNGSEEGQAMRSKTRNQKEESERGKEKHARVGRRRELRTWRHGSKILRIRCPTVFCHQRPQAYHPALLLITVSCQSLTQV